VADANDTVAVLGAGGTMGAAMARNLARAGFAVRAWNRSRAKAEPLVDDGAEVVDAAAEAIRGAGVIITMLADADAVTSTIMGATGDGNGTGAIWVQMGTIGEDGTDRCARLADDRGMVFVDAPVLGTREPAEQGTLVIMASGPERTKAQLTPIFAVLGSRTMWVGAAGTATRLKIATNSWILAVVEGGAETLALAEGLGIDPHLVLEAIQGGPLDLPYLRQKGAAMLARDFSPSFRLALAAKDAALVVESAARHGLDLPLLEAIRQRFEQAVPEHGNRDLSATFLTSAPARATASAPRR